MNWTSLFKRVSLIAFNIAASLVLVELVLRFIYTPPVLEIRLRMNALATQHAARSASQFDHEKMRFVPNSARDMHHVEYELSTAHDALGFRNPCLEKLDAGTQELFLGDSFVYGIGLSDRFTYGCQLIENGLSAYSLGVPGADMAKYLDVLRANGAAVKRRFPAMRRVNLVVFLGNDFESLRDYSSYRDMPEQASGDGKNGLLKLLGGPNRALVTNPYLNKSYALNAAKLLLRPILAPSERKDYVVNFAGSSFYKKGVTRPVEALVDSLRLVDEQIGDLGFSLHGVYLIEDPAALSEAKLQKEMLVAGADHQQIDTRFKFEAVLTACKMLSLKCVDTSIALSAEDYYTHDNHLKDAGAARLARFIAQQKVEEK